MKTALGVQKGVIAYFGYILAEFGVAQETALCT